MIHVTQGHENSIGLEVFLKSFLLLSPKEQSQFILHCNESAWFEYIKLLNFKETSFSQLKKVFSEGELPSSSSLISALEALKAKKDILLTLPTSKDQLKYKDKFCAGYTEFLRHYFERPDISMLFASPTKRIVLMSDHIPLKEVPHYLNSQRIVNKITSTLEGHNKYFYSFDEVIISGINPHAGEGGILGDEEKEIKNAIIYLKEKFPTIQFIGPLPGDTLHMLNDQKKKQLFVYMHHDQGLATFKQEFGLIGLNISLGLPFLRMSVDHGTAFSLYGKNHAHYMGCHYMLKTAIQVQKRLA